MFSFSVARSSVRRPWSRKDRREDGSAGKHYIGVRRKAGGLRRFRGLKARAIRGAEGANLVNLIRETSRELRYASAGLRTTRCSEVVSLESGAAMLKTSPRLSPKVSLLRVE